MNKPCRPIADALERLDREWRELCKTRPFAAMLRAQPPANGLSSLADAVMYALANPVHRSPTEELEQVLVDHAMAELATGKHTIH